MSRVILRWVAGEVRYRLIVANVARGDAIVVAVGPGTTIRISRDAIDEVTLARWLRQDDASRAAAAESLLARGSVDA